MLRLLVLLAAALAVRAQTTVVNRCTYHSGELPINVYIEGCSTPPCLLPQLQDAVINIVFRTPRSIERMTTFASAFLFNILPVPPINYDLGANAVTCNFLQNTYCPVFEGEVIAYQLRMFIESTFPVGTNVNIEFRIVDASNDSAITCIRVPIRIEPPLASQLASNATIGAL